MMRFANKTVVVTGGSRGLGRSIAIAFGAEGARVLVGYATRADAAADVVREIQASGGEGTAVQLDVTDEASVDAAIARTIEARGTIDVLVNAAGVMRNQLFVLSSSADWEEPLRVNLAGALRVTRAVVRPMLAAGRGAIVHLGSIAGMRASPGQAGYSASKGGLVAMTRTLGAELAPRGIRVNAVVPGLCSEGMAQRIDRRAVDDYLSRIPAGRLGAAAEIAAVTTFLASDAASYVIGQSIVVDGGLSL